MKKTNSKRTKEFKKFYKSRSLSDLTSREKTKKIAYYWGKKSAGSRSGRSNPNIGLSFKASHLMRKGNREEAFKIYKEILNKGKEK
tara:strand:- start:1454 stop:1711 length:258 start_codon:yes stop_codon:yes gene_type:complete